MKSERKKHKEGRIHVSVREEDVHVFINVRLSVQEFTQVARRALQLNQF